MRTAGGVIGVILFSANVAAGQDALEVLRKTAQAYRGARTYSLEGTDTLEQVTRAGTRVTKRQFHAWRLEAGMRVDFADGGIRLTDGKSEWNYNPQSKQYSKKPVPWDGRGRRALHEFFYNYDGIADFVKRAEFITPPGEDGFLVEVTYELPGGIASENTKNFWIGPDYAVRRETSYPRAIVEPPTAGPIKLTRTITFEKTTFDGPVDPALFARPPEEPAASGKAPEFTLPDLDGRAFSMQDVRGKLVLLYFWASWCATCRTEMAKLEKVVREYADDEVVLLGINDEDPGIASTYLKSNGHAIRSLVDRWKEVSKMFHVEEVPAVVVIGRDGRILHGMKEAGLE